MARKKPTCKCIDSINKQLAPKGYRLDLAFTMTGEVFPQIKTEKWPLKFEGKRQGIPIVPATHCPFCGTPYVKGMPR